MSWMASRTSSIFVEKSFLIPSRMCITSKFWTSLASSLCSTGLATSVELAGLLASEKLSSLSGEKCFRFVLRFVSILSLVDNNNNSLQSRVVTVSAVPGIYSGFYRCIARSSPNDVSLGQCHNQSTPKQMGF
ncbi:hypothetical protein AMECASPLE_039812 [Ameca splendens]|uniref:Uncharacterized protein n=1 Tax=Ameca splendens TaxID=208324 RepID=A0ABV0YX83_9TELE